VTVLRAKSSDPPAKLYAQVVITTESRYKQAVIMNLLEELLRSYPDEITRYVISSDAISAGAFDTEFAKP
jgi:hypothetical protein